MSDWQTLRMQTWQAHLEDCAGVGEPRSGEEFKHRIWNRWGNDWATCFLEAAKLADKIHLVKNS